MRVRVLGDLQVTVAGERADLGGPKPRALLGLLVAAESRPVTVEQLIDQMWGEEPPARVEASLQSYVARLRRVLEPERNAGAPAARLRTHSGGYSLGLEADDVDARRFATAVREARAVSSADPAAAVAQLDEALQLWHGEPYAGLACSALQAEATRLDELRLAAVADLWELRIGRGEQAAAVAELEQLVRLHPLRERFWALLAKALYRDSRQGDALAALRRAREHLADELGVDPGTELRELEAAILGQDPNLELAVTSEILPSTPERASSLPGRGPSLSAVDEALSAAVAGRGSLVLVTGEPGIGKTRFAEAVVDLARARGLRIGWGGWEADPGPPLHGWSRALGELLARDVLGGLQAGDAASASYQQADLVLDAVRGGPPSLVVLDDVHWADSDSLRLLRRLAGQVSRTPMVVLVTTRHAPAEISATWAEVLAAIARYDPIRSDLTGLDADAVATWVSAQTGRDVPGQIAEELVSRTDGNPFYVTELVRLLIRDGALDDLSATTWRAVPNGVRDVVRQRSRLLPEAATELLSVAAVVGRSVDLAVLESLGGGADAVAEAVEGAQVLGLLEDEGPGRVRFTHALVRDALYEALPAPARARLHAQVAIALESAYAGRVAHHAAELAEHYRLAGPAHVRSAWLFARQGADLASGAAAFDECLRLSALAVDLQELDPAMTAEEREAALVALSRALVRGSRPVEAWAPAEKAARSALGRGDAAAAAAALHVVTDGTVWGWRDDAEYDDDAIALWRQVLDAQPPDATLTRAHLTAGLAAEHLHRPGDPTEATRLADSAVAAVRRSGVRGPEALVVLRLAHMAMLRPELLHHRVPLADELVELATAVGSPADLAAALSNRGYERAYLGRIADARSDVIRAHELAVAHHLPESQVITGWSLATFHQLDGDFAAAESAITANEQLHVSLAMAGEGIALAQRVFLLDGQGRLAELEPVLRELRLFHPALREVHALSMVRAAKLDELRLLLGEWSDQAAVLPDYQWLLLSSIRAEIWTALGDQAAVSELQAQLLPHADDWAVTLPVGFRGSMRLTLGRLAAAAGDPAAARTHLELARDRHEELGLPQWVRAADEELARL